MNNYDPDWQYFGFFPLKFPSKKGLKFTSSRHPPPLSGLPVSVQRFGEIEEEERLLRQKTRRCSVPAQTTIADVDGKLVPTAYWKGW